MSQAERLTQIRYFLEKRRFVSMKSLQDTFEMSRSTIKRDLDYLRERHHFPIAWSAKEGGYFLDREMKNDGGVYLPPLELPGYWFGLEELQALLLAQQLLASVQFVYFRKEVGNLQNSIRDILGEKRRDEMASLLGRVRFLRHQKRSKLKAVSEVVVQAVAQRRCLKISYDARSSGERTERVICPQRLVYYRDNWYLDAWCHVKKALRSFSVDQILNLNLLNERARDIPEDTLNEVLGSGYGVFSGKAKHRAHLRFSPRAARWVADEEWHPKQKGWFEGEEYHLQIPYADHRELVMDILRYGPDVEVLGPDALREKVRKKLQESLKKYGGVI